MICSLVVLSSLLLYPMSSSTITNIMTISQNNMTTDSAMTALTDDSRHTVIPQGWNSTNPLIPPYFTRRPKGTIKSTFRPTARLTARPTGVRCFSTTGDVGVTAYNKTLIQYYYRMILRNNKTTPNVILPTLEVALTNQLIPSLFPECTTTKEQIRILSSNATNTATISSTSIITGMTSSPQDIVISSDSSGVCNTTTTINSSTTATPSCYTLKGGLTVYVTGDAKSSEVALMNRQTQQTIQGLMNNGTLNSVHTSIVQLIYVGSTDPSLIPQVQNTTTISSTTTKSNGLSMGFIIIGSFLGLLIGLFGVRHMIRQRKQQQVLLPQLLDQDQSSQQSVTSSLFPDFITTYDDSRKDLEGLEAGVVEVTLNSRSTRYVGYQYMK